MRSLGIVNVLTYHISVNIPLGQNMQECIVIELSNHKDLASALVAGRYCSQRVINLLRYYAWLAQGGCDGGTFKGILRDSEIPLDITKWIQQAVLTSWIGVKSE